MKIFGFEILNPLHYHKMQLESAKYKHVESELAQEKASHQALIKCFEEQVDKYDALNDQYNSLYKVFNDYKKASKKK